MNKLIKWNPALAGALAAAVSYYALAPLFLRRPLCFAVLFFILTAAACFFHAMAFLPPALLAGKDGTGHCSPARRAGLARRAAVFAVFVSGGILIGFLARGAAFRESVVAPGLPRGGVTGISGTLLDDPRTNSAARGMANLRLAESAGSGGVRVSAWGRTLVFFPEGSIPRLKEFGRGSTIFVEGNFVEPKNNLDGGAMFRASGVHIVKPPSALERLRTRCRLAVIKVFGEKWGGLALALLLGIKDNLDSELAQKYQKSGCSYILALSGMHLAVVSSIIAFALKKPLGLKAAAALGSCFILLYVYLVGAAPSLNRAALMYIIGAAAMIFSLPKDALQLLALSFIAQIMIDPLSGTSVSFILSYLALAGILILGGRIEFFTRGRLPPFLSEPLSVSLGAFLATISITVFFFGELRFTGIAAGLVMAPLTTLFMMLSIAYLALSFIFPVLNVPLDFALSFLYKALEKIATLAGSAPPLTLKNPAPAVILGIIIPLLVIFLHRLDVKRKYRIDALQ
jgi:competence protein ComEC